MCPHEHRRRQSIRNAITLVKAITQVQARNPALLWGSVASTVVYAGMLALMMICMLVGFSSGSEGAKSNTGIGQGVYILFFLPWQCQVHSNWLHVAVAGVWRALFRMPSMDQASAAATYEHVAVASFSVSAKRAATTQLGPIARGSLGCVKLYRFLVFADIAAHGQGGCSRASVRACVIACVIA
jgi:hypothetical protein